MFAGVIWVVFSRSYWSICHQFVFVCVCALCLHPVVPIWWSDLGSIMSPAGVLFRFVTLAPTALWAIRDHLQQACPKHTTAVECVGRSKRSLRGFDWFPHLRASLSLLITDQGTASHTRPRSTAGAGDSMTDCRGVMLSVYHHRGWDFTTGRIQLQLFVNYLTTRAGFQLQCPWYKAFTN